MTDREVSDRMTAIDWEARLEARAKEIGILTFKNASLQEVLLQVKHILERARLNADTEAQELAEAALHVIENLLREPWMTPRDRGPDHGPVRLPV